MSGVRTRVRWLPSLPYVLAAYGTRLLIALVAVHPFVALVKRTLGGWPNGDRMVFDPGGLMLAEVVRLHGPALWSFAEQSTLVLLLMVPVGVVLCSIVLSSLAVESASDVRAVLARAVDRIAPVAALTVAQILGVLGTVFMSVVIREPARSALSSAFNARTTDLISVAAFSLGLLAAVAVLIVTDLARVTAVQQGLDTAQASVHALTTLARHPGRVVAAFAARASASVFALTLTIALSLSVGVTTPGRAAAVLFVQQVCIIATGCLRASWFARAMDLSTVNDGDCDRS